MNNRVTSWPTAVLGVLMLTGTASAAEIQVIASLPIDVPLSILVRADRVIE